VVRAYNHPKAETTSGRLPMKGTGRGWFIFPAVALGVADIERVSSTEAA